MIDGAMARKTNAVSSFGSKLDTVADTVFMVVCAVKLLPMVNLPVLLWIWIGTIAMMKATNIILEFIRRKELMAYHTVLNKLTGMMLFVLPFTLQWIEPRYSFAVVCSVATIAAIGEGYYTIKANNK
jgi:CDP-diacylglycerol--glycerol-3-phosphate 3-phosphatidyltransferase